MFKFSILVALFFSFSTFAATKEQQYEVTADSFGNIAYMNNRSDTTNFYSDESRDVACKYKVFGKDIEYRRDGFDISGNPFLATRGGKTYLICMSVNLDYSKGSIDFSLVRNGKLSEWKNIVNIDDGIPDKPVLAINENGDLALSYIDIKLNDKGLKTQLKLLFSKNEGTSWNLSKIKSSDSTLDNVAFANGEQGNYSWSEKEKFYLSVSYYEKAQVDLYESLDNGFSYDLVDSIQFDKTSENFEPPVTKPILDKSNGLKAIILYFGHSFSQSLLFPFQNRIINKPIEISKSSTMLDGVFHRNQFYLLQSSLSNNIVQTKVKVWDESFSSVIFEKILSTESEYSENYYYGAYQKLLLKESEFEALFIDYSDFSQRLERVAIPFLFK